MLRVRPSRSARLLRWSLAAWLAALALPAAAVAQNTAAPDRAELLRMLSSFESSPSAARWRAMGTRVLPSLTELYGDEAVAPFVRLRALAAIGAFRTQAARRVLVRAASDPAVPEVHAREAVLALGRTWGAAAVADLAPRLDDPRALVREAAARALLRIRSPRARQLLAARLQVETDPAVRDALQGR